MKTKTKTLLISALTLTSFVTTSCGVSLELFNQLQNDHNKLKTDHNTLSTDFNSFKQKYPELKKENDYLINKYNQGNHVNVQTAMGMDFEIKNVILNQSNRTLNFELIVLNKSFDKDVYLYGIEVVDDKGNQYKFQINHSQKIYKDTPTKVSLNTWNINGEISNKLRILNFTLADGESLTFKEIDIK